MTQWNLGMQAMFPVYLSRRNDAETDDAFNSAVAQNENNLNQNFTLIVHKLAELEAVLLALTETDTP